MNSITGQINVQDDFFFINLTKMIKGLKTNYFISTMTNLTIMIEKLPCMFLGRSMGSKMPGLSNINVFTLF